MNTAKAGVKTRRLQGAISLKIIAEIFGRVAQLGTLALAARILSLSDFGRYSLALVLGFLLAQLADFGLHLSVTRQLSRAEGKAFAQTALANKLWLFPVLILVAAIAALLDFSSTSFAFFLLIFSALLYSLAEFGFAVLRAREGLHYEARLVIFHRVALLLGVVIASLGGAGLTGIAIAHLLAGGLVAFSALQLAGVRPTGGFNPKLLRASAPIGLAIFLSLLAFKVDVPLLQILSGRSEEVGLYNAAYRLFEPLLLFPAALLAGLFPALSRAAHAQVGQIFQRQALKLMAGLFGAGIVAGGALAVVASWLVPWLFGKDYAAAGPTLSLLALAVPFLFVNSGLTHLLLALDRERYNLWFFGAVLTLNLAANLILIPLWGRNGAAFATFLTEAGLTLMCGFALMLTLNFQLSEVIVGLKELSLSKIVGRVPLARTISRNPFRSSTPEVISPPQIKAQAQPFVSVSALKIRKFGFGALLVLVVCLPFEFTQLPFLSLGSWLTLNNLKLVYYINIGLALTTLGLERKTLLVRLRQWREPGLWLGLLLVAFICSSIFSVVPRESFKFTFDLALGGILWLALPFWLEEARLNKLRLITGCLVGSAAVSAGLGLLEFVPELKVNDWLLWPFKVGATVAGPFLRLSGTFEYANIAAIYYELALPFALVSLARAVAFHSEKRGAVSESNFETPPENSSKNAGLKGLRFRLSNSVWWRIGLRLLACGILWEALLLSFSRSALPGMLVATPVIFWAVRHENLKRWWRGLALGFGVGLALVGLTILLSPVMVLRFKTQSDQGWFRAGYSAPTLTSLTICQQLSVPVTVHNQTPLDWRGGPDGAYLLSYHWLDQPDHIYQFEGIRSELPRLLKAGERAQVQAKLRAPNKPGQYWLVWDIVQEDVSWFSLKSAVYERQPVEILAANDATACAAPNRSGTKAPPSILPEVPPSPERGQLWKVAGQMISARPILGVGPDGYRFAYGVYAGLKDWDTRIFANSTPLELAADLGIVGSLLFAVFLGLALWPLIARGWQGRLHLVEAASLAALVAFGLHGLLDYFLGFHAIFILFWLLLGISVSSGWSGKSSLPEALPGNLERE